MKKLFSALLSALLTAGLLLTAAYAVETSPSAVQIMYLPAADAEPADRDGSNEADDAPIITLNDGCPEFTVCELGVKPFIAFSELDKLGRCGTATACLGPETLPTAERKSIGDVLPSGWQLKRYDGIVDGHYLYNRCHLIGYQLCGVNSDPTNLITGTRFFNNSLMLPYETAVARYITESGNHVLYRAEPVYDGGALVASGLILEGYSVEDYGEGVCFRVYIKNIQPGIEIDYSDGSSKVMADFSDERDIPAVPAPVLSSISNKYAETNMDEAMEPSYILNTNTHKFHCPDCESVKDISPGNRGDFYGEREELIARGYSPCGRCHP